MRPARTAFCLAYIFAAGFPAWSRTVAPTGERPRLRVAISKNIELFAALANLTSEWERLPIRSPQAVEARQRFFAFREHRAVRMTQSLLRRKGPGSLMRLAIRLSDFPEARIPQTDVPFFSRGQLTRAVSAAREFYIESGFEDYWRESRPAREQWAAETERSLAAVPIVETVEDFFGAKKDDYVLLLAPQADRLRTRDVLPMNGRSQAIVIFGPFEGVPDLLSSADARTLAVEIALREFSQVFIAGIVEKHRQTAKKYAYLQELALRRRGIAGLPKPWLSFWIDNLTAGAHARTAVAIFGQAAAGDVLDRIHKGDLLARDIFEICAAYEADRGRFPDFQSFLPELMARLEGRLAQNSEDWEP